MTFPVLPGAEPWSFNGSGERSRIGILMAHGFTGCPASLRPLAELFARRGFALELVRLPGHGTHFRDMMSTRYEDWRGEVADGLARLAARSESVIALGISMGGTLVLDLVSQDPKRVAGAVVINSQVLDRKGILVKLGPLLEHVVPLVPASAVGLVRNDIAKPGVNELAYSWVPAKSGNSLVREFPRIRKQLPNITCPILVAYSRADHSVPPENSRAILRAVRSRDVTELPLERSFHVATLDYDLELIEQRVTAFADRVAAKDRPSAASAQ
ncbi:MAG TPA: alpha/beta fold hydrolase [Polyangiaceae bacterium]|nr:alpha/beta fold hydrolase [Polyangiaceae bacterium]